MIDPGSAVGPAVEDASEVGREPLAGFSRAARNWFTSAFETPTHAQIEAWRAIQSGKHALVIAPTGSGKTLAAFLWAIDELARRKDGFETDAESKDTPSDTPDGVKVLYISPLKALGVDVERNLRAPLAGIREATVALGEEAPNIHVGVRSGDTTAAERRRLLTKPPDILITTPESLYLLLTSKGARTLRSVETVIVDEVHALAGNKRGAHLALSLERLDSILRTPAQRIGLSATVEPASEVARFLGGDRLVELVRPESRKAFDITIDVPAPDMTNPPVNEQPVNASSPGEHRLGSMWPSIERSLYQRIIAARSTIVFTNSRRLAERLTSNLNELHAEALEEQVAATTDSTSDSPHSPSSATGFGREIRELTAGRTVPVLARAHHGSVSKEHRLQVEEDLKSGVLRCVVATASLELGIDMGEVDLVVQIDPPPSVSSGLQRLGRSGHQVGAVSTAVFYPTHRSKLLETAVIAQRMKSGIIEPLSVLSNPLDVLAQQTIAAAVAGPLHVDRWYETVRRSAPFVNLPKSAYISVLDLISGKYPSTEFAALRARVDWDRTTNVLTARPGAQRLAVTNGGTIPDRGLYRVVTVSAEDGGTRVGELDEEMVYETRVGEVFTLGTTPWRVLNITKDSVEVAPATGVIAKMPFWRSESQSRPVEVGRALGQLTSLLATNSPEESRVALTETGFDESAVANVLSYLHEQTEHTGFLPTDRILVVERTRDDVGDWQLILESPLGLAIHSPWALAISARLRDRWGLDTRVVPSNDGIIVRLPDFDAPDDLGLASELGAPDVLGSGERRAPTAADIFLFEPDEIVEIVRNEVANSAVFASRFREAAARALILGNSKPGRRSPLWQQRLRSAALLEVASRYPDFPIILEALREVLQDMYDVNALASTMRDLRSRSVSLVEVRTETPSPFARAQLFGYVGEFLYEGDAPIGERRIAALSVDPAVLRELLGEVPLRDLLDSAAIFELHSELQRTKPGWQARDVSGLVDLLRSLGPLTLAELIERYTAEEPVQERCVEKTESRSGDSTAVQASVTEALRAHQIFEVQLAGITYLAASEDAGLLSSLSGAVPPPGTPIAFLGAVTDPARELLLRHAATRGPFSTEQIATRFGLAATTVHATLRQLETAGTLASGLFLPPDVATAWGINDDETQWVSRSVLDQLRARSLAILRGSIEAADPEVFAQFLASWQRCNGGRRGIDGVLETVVQLSGVPIPASAWETLVLPQRVSDYQPTFIDQLVADGEVRWSGAGSIGTRDGWVSLVPTGEQVIRPAQMPGPRTELEEAILNELGRRGALFASSLADGLVGIGFEVTETTLSDAIWALVWDGLVTSDSVAALRARVSGNKSSQKTALTRPRGRSLTRRSMANLRLAGAPITRTGSGPISDPSLAGRWSLVEAISTSADEEPVVADPQLATPSTLSTSGALGGVELTLWAVEMLERYGIVTRGAVTAEGFPGGFAQAYRLYADFELAGVCRRGYFVKGLGGAQFAIPGAVDQLRDLAESTRRDDHRPRVITLATTDPANPYGAAIPWPQPDANSALPKRSPGSLITLIDGQPAFYLERGGKTALAFSDFDEQGRATSIDSLVQTVRKADLATFTVERVNGVPVRESEWAAALLTAGFSELPRGFTLRRKIH